jgi:ABC-2 type transport system ATP-binding protein
VSISGVTRGRRLDRVSLTVPVGMRLLVVSDPHESASELLRVVAGLARPGPGSVEVAGLTAGWGGRVAYLAPEPGIPRWLTPREALGVAGDLLGLPPEVTKRRGQRVLARCGIGTDLLDRPVGRGGPPLIQRTGLAAALLGDPEVLLLDEPLRAIEGDERATLLQPPPGRHRTLLLASRYPAGEEGLVDHLLFMRDGHPVVLTGIDELARSDQPLSMRGILALAAAAE